MKTYFKTVISTVLCYLMVLSMLPVSSLTAFAASYTGAGTESNPYMVSTGAELTEVLSLYNTNGVYIKLDSDITLGSGYVPGVFNAVLDGDFHKITAVSKFFTTNNGTLKNFFYTDTVAITDDSLLQTGVVCDENKGLISGVIGNGKISGKSDVGIIAGVNSGTIINCAAFGEVFAGSVYGCRAGGITAGGGRVYNCYVSAKVAASGGSRYGSGYSNPISNGSFADSYYNSELYTAGNSGGFTASKMKISAFVKLLNSGTETTDCEWVQDTSNKNSGFPVLKRSLNCKITSSKTNVVISGTEYITLSGSDSSATIYYTTNGSTPTTSSTRYSGSIAISDDITIKAIAYKNGLYSKPFVFSYSKTNGAGTKDNPYVIDSSAAFFAVSELENDAYYILTKDIVLEKAVTSIEEFYGHIDGQGYKISSVYTDSLIYGIFKNNYGVIENINFEVKEDKELISSAGIVACNYGVVYNCNFEGNLNSLSVASGFTANTGGIASNNYGRLEKCSFEGGVYSKNTAKAGGIVAYNDGEVYYCNFDGVVDTYAVTFGCKQGYVGGFVGYTTAESSIKYCHANATKVFSSPRNYSGVYVGAFVGNSSTTAIVDCTATIGSVSYAHFYTEWGYNATNTYTGITELGYKPVAHAHNYDVQAQSPKCGEYMKADCFCECGVCVTSEWYDAEWRNKTHIYSEDGFVITTDPTCTQAGEARKYCTVCDYYAVMEVPATEHLGVATLVNSSLYPESEHTYSYNMNETKTFTYPGADYLKLGFSSKTMTEANYDYIYLYDKDDNRIGIYSGSQLQGKEILVAGDTFKIRLSTNGNYQYYGYSFDFIYAYSSGDILVEDKSLYPESSHDYSNYLNETKSFSKPGASNLKITFSADTEVEANYDKIYLYDGKDQQIGVYTGTQLAGVTVTIQGDTFKIKLTSDSMVTKYGYKIDSIYARIEGYGEWETTAEPTCTVEGEKQRVCAMCQYVNKESIAALGHSFTNYVSDNNATYTQDATKTAVCDRCEETDTLTESGTKLRPTSIAIQTVPEKTLYVMDGTVDLSGLVFVAYYADGGSYEFTSSEVDSCSADMQSTGKKTVAVTYMDCTATFEIYVHERGSVLLDSALYPESDHNYGNYLNQTKMFTHEGAYSLTVKFNASTFVENNCDKIYLYDKNDVQIGVYTGSELAGVTVSIPGDTLKIKLTSDYSVTKYGYKIDSIYAETGVEMIHPEVIDAATVTCTQNGLTQGSHCEICGLILVEQVQSFALGHSFTNYVSDNNGFCLTDGTKTAKCDRCDKTDTMTDEDSAPGHDYKQTVVAPTCTAKGYTTYTCSCGDSYVSDYVEKIAHPYEATVIPASLTKNGSIVKKCTVCGDENTSAVHYVKTVSLSVTSYTFNGKVKTPSVIVKDSAGNVLTKNADYTVTYSEGRTNAGTYNVTVRMQGNYTGTKTLSFRIKPIDISTCTVKLSNTSYTFDGNVKTPAVSVINSYGTTLKSTNYTVNYAEGRKNAGTYNVTVTMKGNYTGTKTLSFKIKPIDISTCTVKLSNTSYTFNGNVKTPSVTVTNSYGTKLKATNYTVTYAEGRKNAGTYNVTVKMIGNYTGTKVLTFNIKPLDISTCDVKLAATNYTFTGYVKNPAVIITNSYGTRLTKDKHYTVTYGAGRKDVGVYTVTVNMKGNYTGTKTLSFNINPIDISDCTVKLSNTSYTYNGNVRTPTVSVINSYGTKLKATNYTVTYSEGRTAPGTYNVTVKMKGNYMGSKTLSFKIKPIDISTCTVKLSNTSYTYNGKVKTPTVSVINSYGTKIKDTNYTVTYAEGRTAPGTYNVTVKMKGNYTGSKTFSFTIKPIDISTCTVKLSSTSYTYNGYIKTPKVTVTNSYGTKLTKDKHYTVSYSEGRTDVGTYYVTVNMIGNYTGTKILTFKINP